MQGIGEKSAGSHAGARSSVFEGYASFERAAIALGSLSGSNLPQGEAPGPCDAAPPCGGGLLLRLSVLQAIRPASGMRSEGLGASLRNLLICEMLRQPGRSPPASLHLVANAVQAAEIGLAAVAQRGHRAFAPALLRDMHAALCAGLAVQGHPGGWRGAAAGGESAARDAATRLCADLGAPDPRAPLLARMAAAAAALTGAAPFEFGNDVLARLLPALIAAAEGMPPVIVGVLPAASGAAGVWTDYFEAFAAHARHAAELSRLLRDLHAAWVRRLITLRSDSNARRLIDCLFTTPVMTVGQAERLLGVSFQTANAAVATLIAHRILVPHGGLRRNRIFVMPEVFDLLEGLSGRRGPLSPLLPFPAAARSGPEFSPALA